ncbi:hypothetical protein SS7213T_00906 [Staphylococcus simiae CCM 7213 = CCUG 51256]|uniref:Uncharacterized protein n=1 Tax=Staphylococcus simiae CCM 7213 = CCUG 51256 TaxID=911238 RepID=G5JFG9_9STAP|nr:hypothetical protein SS7213T_00906 [Staphylococcus simiae CCM 7213 = CCUG 51256]
MLGPNAIVVKLAIVIRKERREKRAQVLISLKF